MPDIDRDARLRGPGGASLHAISLRAADPADRAGFGIVGAPFRPPGPGRGLTLSFTLIGTLVASLGASVGLDPDILRPIAAALLAIMGLVLIVPRLQVALAAAASPFGNWSERRFGGFSTRGWSGQFGFGLPLGTVWSPCAGPTLGAASIAAASTASLGSVAATMAMFGIGAALPLLGLGALSRTSLVRWRTGCAAPPTSRSLSWVRPSSCPASSSSRASTSGPRPFSSRRRRPGSRS